MQESTKTIQTMAGRQHYKTKCRSKNHFNLHKGNSRGGSEEETWFVSDSLFYSVNYFYILQPRLIPIVFNSKNTDFQVLVILFKL